jgi:flagellar biogenesis protein FliO
MVGDSAVDELLVLTARELVVLILLVVFLVWVAYRIVRESRR